MAGVEFSGRAETVSYESGKKFSYKTTTGIQSTFTYTAESQGGGVKVTVDVTYDVPGSLALEDAGGGGREAERSRGLARGGEPEGDSRPVAPAVVVLVWAAVYVVLVDRGGGGRPGASRADDRSWRLGVSPHRAVRAAGGGGHRAAGRPLFVRRARWHRSWCCSPVGWCSRGGG